MQASAPEAVDIEQEPGYAKDLYGMDGSNTEDFGENASSPEDWSNGVFALFRFTRADITMTTIGMPMVI